MATTLALRVPPRERLKISRGGELARRRVAVVNDLQAVESAFAREQDDLDGQSRVRRVVTTCLDGQKRCADERGAGHTRIDCQVDGRAAAVTHAGDRRSVNLRAVDIDVREAFWRKQEQEHLALPVGQRAWEGHAWTISRAARCRAGCRNSRIAANIDPGDQRVRRSRAWRGVHDPKDTNPTGPLLND